MLFQQLFKADLVQVISGLYYKPMTIVNEDSRVVNKLETSLTDNGTVIIYDRHVFIVQATGYSLKKVLNIMFPIANC
jgi:hypothetical protein